MNSYKNIKNILFMYPFHFDGSILYKGRERTPNRVTMCYLMCLHFREEKAVKVLTELTS